MSSFETGISKIRFETWEKEGHRLFGDNRKLWRFVCPLCKGVQTPQDFYDHTDLDEEKVRNVFFFSCIGRWAKDKRGCDYTCGGLLDLSKVRIFQRGRWISAFAFDGAGLMVEENPIVQYAELDKLIEATGDAPEVAWPEWVPESIRKNIREFWGCFGRTPKSYFEAWTQNEAPDFGLEEEWDWRDKRAEGKKGRFVYAWNNIGRCVYPDGTVGYPSI